MKLKLETNPELLKPGFQTKPTVCGNASTWYERSGDGKTLRLIRQTGSTTIIAKTWTF